MKSAKQLREELDAAKLRALGIVNAAKKAGRELSEEEAAEFKKITEQEVPAGQKALATAEAREEEVRALTQRRDIETTADQYSADLATAEVANNERLVLPYNGQAQPEARAMVPAQARHVGRMKAFKDAGEAFASGMWLRAVIAREFNRPDRKAAEYCAARGIDIRAAGETGTPSLGGYTVPTPLSAAIVDVRERVSVMRQLVRILPMTSGTLDVPKRVGGLTAYVIAELGDMSANASDKTWGQINLVAKKRFVLHQISQELVDDSLIAIVDDAVSEMGTALGLQEDATIINGDGTPTYGDVVGLRASLGAGGTHTAATGRDTWDELIMADFTAAMALLPDKFDQAGSPAWVCSRNFYYSTMLRLEAIAGGNTFQTIATGDGMPPRPLFLGAPVYFTGQMPTSSAAATVSALYGVFSQAVMMGERMGVQIARSDDVAFMTDATTLKATARYDVDVHEPGDASNAGAYVGLSTAAA